MEKGNHCSETSTCIWCWVIQNFSRFEPFPQIYMCLLSQETFGLNLQKVRLKKLSETCLYGVVWMWTCCSLNSNEPCCSVRKNWVTMTTKNYKIYYLLTVIYTSVFCVCLVQLCCCESVTIKLFGQPYTLVK